MDTAEGNKLIAEFMGCNPTPFKNSGGSGYDVKLNGVPKEGYMSYALAEYGSKEQVLAKLLEWPFYYHSSWDWLMPACKKFDTLNLLDIEYENLCDEIDNAVSCYEIEPAFKNLVEAIIWYNNSIK